MSPLTIIPNHIFAFYPLNFVFSGLESLVPKGGIVPPGNTDVVPLNWK